MSVFNWIRPGYELVTVKLEWNVQVPFLQTGDGNGQRLDSHSFSPRETPDSEWKLGVFDYETLIGIYPYHLNSAGERTNFFEPVLVKMSILDAKRRKVLQQMVPSHPNYYYVEFLLSKEDIFQSECQQLDGSLTFYCKIVTHVKRVPVVSADPSGVAINCLDELSNELEGLFDGMPLSDVNFNIRGHQFPAHKLILSTRSKYFEAMFKHPMEEQSTNQIEIEDIKPEVFQELLRFIYTGRVSTATLDTMAAGLFIAADKYLMDKLKIKCENYLLNDMSPNDCIELLLNFNLLNSAEQLKKEAAKSFRRFPLQVMATSQWEQVKQENPVALVDIQKIAFSHK